MDNYDCIPPKYHTDPNGIVYSKTGRFLTSGSTAPNPDWREAVVSQRGGFVYLPPHRRGGYAGAAITEFEVVEVDDALILDKYKAAYEALVAKHDETRAVLYEAAGIIMTYRYKKCRDFLDKYNHAGYF